MENALNDIVAHNLQNRTFALIENGTWAPTACELMRAQLSKLKNTTILDTPVRVMSSVKDAGVEQLGALAQAIVDSMHVESESEAPAADESVIDQNAMFKLSYGLFVLSARDGARDNGCIINTVMQVTDTPKRIAIAVNKANLTHDMIAKTGEFTLSVLSENAAMDTFKRFGFQSGRDADKFAGLEGVQRAANGINYITGESNALISGKVISTQDLGTHTLFVADVTEARVLDDAPSAYDPH